jgi:hypothetical protein
VEKDRRRKKLFSHGCNIKGDIQVDYTECDPMGELPRRPSRREEDVTVKSKQNEKEDRCYTDPNDATDKRGS